MNLLKKLYDMRSKKKTDNKGFSLVELIIVIAIMAILVGVVGTQVIPYIEKSRKAKDTQILSGFCTDATTAFGSTAAELDATKPYTITIGSTNVTTAGGSDAENTKLTDAFKELNSVTKLSDIKFSSKAGKAIGTITITCSDANGVTVSTTMKTGTDASLKFDTITSTNLASPTPAPKS